MCEHLGLMGHMKMADRMGSSLTGKIAVKPLRLILAITLLAGLTIAQFGCESSAAQGGLIGAAGGAGLGAIIGNNVHGQTAGGAAIGAGVGAISGYMIGNEIDKHKTRERLDRLEGREAYSNTY